MATTTSNMALSTPEVGDSDYATSVSDSFDNIDSHDHSAGKGVQIPSGGIADSAVTANKLASASITSGKPALSSTDDSSLEVSGGVYRIKDGGVTRAKLASLGQQSGSVTNPSFTTSSSTAVDVTGLTASITTTGRPVAIVVSSALANVGISQSGALQVPFLLLRGATQIVSSAYGASITSSGFPLFAYHIDTPTAGTYTYKVQTYAPGGVGSVTYQGGITLTVFEL